MESPLYVTVMECRPGDNDVIVSVAHRCVVPVPVRGFVASVVVPSMNVTVPVTVLLFT